PMPHGLRSPDADTTLPPPHGVSAGMLRSRLYRSTLPRLSRVLCAAPDVCSAPSVTYSLPSAPDASLPPLWQQSGPDGSVMITAAPVPVPAQSRQRITCCCVRFASE